MTTSTNNTEKSLHMLAMLRNIPNKRGWKTKLAEWFGVELRVLSKWIERDRFPKKRIIYAVENGFAKEEWWMGSDNDDIPSEKPSARSGSTISPDRAPITYPITPEHMLGPKELPPGEPLPGSFGIPDLEDHKVSKIYIPLDHQGLIAMFKDKEMAKELNSLLLKIERLDPDEFQCILAYLHAKVETLERIKKNKNRT